MRPRSPSAARCPGTAFSTVSKLRLWAIVFWLLVWQAGSMALTAAYQNGGLLLASPMQVILRLLELLPSAAFWRTVGNSSARIFGGFALSCTLACLLAALAAAYRRIAELLAPLTAAVKAIPVASFIILALVWLDSRNLSLFISALVAFPPVYGNVLEGLRQTDRKLLELAQVYRVPLGRRLWGIYLPQVLPYFRSAVSLALGLCWKAGAAAEVIGLPSGTIGERLYTSKIYLQTPDLFAWTLVILALSAAFEHLFLRTVDALAGKAGC